MPSTDPTPVFPFNTTRNGVIFTAALVLLAAVIQAVVTHWLARRKDRRDAEASRRQGNVEKLCRSLNAVEHVLSDTTSGRRAAFEAACAEFREIANVDLAGRGSERIQARAGEFIADIEALERQLGPVGPYHEVTRSLFDDFRSSLYAYVRGWRVPGRLRHRPGVLHLHRRHPAGIPPPVREPPIEERPT